MGDVFPFSTGWCHRAPWAAADIPVEERLEDDVPQAKLRVAFFGNHFQTVPYGCAADAGLKDPPAEALEVPHTVHFLLMALNWKLNTLI